MARVIEDNNKINRRSRPRPYDLRRKVLLKNFLREQMTYIPHTRLTSSVQNSDADFSMESSNSSEEIDEDLTGLNDENSSAAAPGIDNTISPVTDIAENSLVNEINEDDNRKESTDSTTSVNIPNASATENKFFRFSSIMNLRSDYKKKKAKGIVKAKKVCKKVKSPVKSKTFKTGLEKLLSGRSRISHDKSSDRITRSSSKSLFSLFKSRKEQRKAKEKERSEQQSSNNDAKSSSSTVETSSCTSNQSVQTDDSWARRELTKVEKSNKLLREENRLLSESLSYFMSSNSLDSHLNRCSLPLQSSNRHLNGMRRYPGCNDNLSACSSYGYDNWNPRSRILRSKSVQEYGEKRNPSRFSHRTRSMNYHNNRNEFYPRPTRDYSSQAQQTVIPRVGRPNVLANLPIYNTGRVVQRRSSMPERILSENDRSRVCRRSGSVRDNRTPFHALPAEAFY